MKAFINAEWPGVMEGSKCGSGSGVTCNRGKWEGVGDTKRVESLGAFCCSDDNI